MPLVVLLTFALAGGGPDPKDSIVTVNVDSVTVGAGTSSTAVLNVRVKKGYHIQADSVADEFLIPTGLEMEAGDHLIAGKVDFPPAVEFRLQGADDTWLVYDGSFEIRVAFAVPGDAREGVRMWRGALRYQACDDRRCLPPDTLEFDIPVTVF